MARRSKGDGSLYKRSDGTWIGRMELPSTDGKRRTKTVSSKDRNVCMEKLKKLRRDVEDGKIAVTGKTTVAQWLDRWMNDIHAETIRQSTRISYEATIRLYIKPAIGTKRLEKLMPQDIRDMHKHARKTSQRAAEKAQVVIQRALDDAVNEGMVARNVAKLVRKPHSVSKQREPLTSDQAKQLLRVAIDNGDPWVTRWAAALLLGARRGELLGLQWDRVDLETGLVDISWQLQQLQQAHGCGDRDDAGGYPCGRKRPGWCPKRRWDLPPETDYQVLHRSICLTRPKTRAGYRLVPLPLPLWEMLRHHPHGTNPHNLVWHYDDGRPLDPRRDYDHWQHALSQAGLPNAPLHVARHTTATLLLEAGVSEQVRMQILGHTSVQVTRGYAHVDQAMAREAMKSLVHLLEPSRE